MNSKNFMLFSALLITIWLAWREPSEGNDIALSKRVQNTVIQTNIAVTAEQLTLQDRVVAPSQLDLFGAVKPVEALKPVTKRVLKPLLPASPQAPPLPFKLIGRMQVGEGSQVLLDVKDEVMPVAVGDILLGQYKVLAIHNNANSTQIQMLYMPINQIQTLNALTIN